MRGAVTLPGLGSPANVVGDASTTQRFASERRRPSRPCNLSAFVRVCKPPLTKRSIPISLASSQIEAIAARLM